MFWDAKASSWSSPDLCFRARTLSGQKKKRHHLDLTKQIGKSRPLDNYLQPCWKTYPAVMEKTLLSFRWAKALSFINQGIQKTPVTQA